MSSTNRRRWRWASAASLFLALSYAMEGSALALPYTVTVDTSAESGGSASLAFDFADGGIPGNFAAIHAFATDGTLSGAPVLTGDVSGMLPGLVALGDGFLFNGYLEGITFGSFVSFVLDASTQAPFSGSFPDTFSFSLLEQGSGLPLFATTDPSGSGALFRLEYDGSPTGKLSVYTATDSPISWTVVAVPEPQTVVLMAAGLLLLLTHARKLQRRHREQ
jgi:hypothetical protein